MLREFLLNSTLFEQTCRKKYEEQTNCKQEVPNFSAHQWFTFCVSSSVPSADPGLRGRGQRWGLYSCPPPSPRVSVLSSSSRPAGSSSPSTPNLPSSRYFLIVTTLSPRTGCLHKIWKRSLNDFQSSIFKKQP